MPEKKEEIRIIANDMLPVVFADNLTVNKREDNIHLLRFLSSLPEGLKEQFRVMIPEASLHKMLDVLCQFSDYYPSRKKCAIQAIDKLRLEKRERFVMALRASHNECKYPLRTE